MSASVLTIVFIKIRNYRLYLRYINTIQRHLETFSIVDIYLIYALILHLANYILNNEIDDSTNYDDRQASIYFSEQVATF